MGATGASGGGAGASFAAGGLGGAHVVYGSPAIVLNSPGGFGGGAGAGVYSNFQADGGGGGGYSGGGGSANNAGGGGGGGNYVRAGALNVQDGGMNFGAGSATVVLLP